MSVWRFGIALPELAVTLVRRSARRDRAPGPCDPGRMPEIDVVDATWIDVGPASLAVVLAEPANWRRWWPDLVLQVDEWRGRKGMRWFVRSGRDGTLTGSMEVWLQAIDDGTVAHFFLRLDGVARPLRRQERERLAHEYRVRMKRVFWALSDRLDPGRLARVAGPPHVIP
jgi:hypothetical protein